MAKKETLPLCLIESELSRFLSSRRPRRCEMILTLHHPNMIASRFGRVPANCLYSVDIVVAATLCYSAWNASRRSGMLQNFAWLDAMGAMENRIKGSLSGANDGMRWGSVLFKRLNVEMAQQLNHEEMEWWQGNADLLDLRGLRQPENFTKLLAAFRLLIENSSHLFIGLETETLSVDSISPVVE